MHASYGLLGLVTRLKLVKLLQGKHKFTGDLNSSFSSSSSSSSSSTVPSASVSSSTTSSEDSSSSHQRESLELLSHMQKNNQQMDPLDIPVSIAQQQALLAQVRSTYLSFSWMITLTQTSICTRLLFISLSTSSEFS